MGFAIMKHDRGGGRRASRRSSTMPDRDARGVRVGIKKGGCAGMEYSIDLVTEPDAKDDLVEFGTAQSVWVAAGSRALPARHRDGFRGDDAALRLHLQQSEPDVRLRLR
jgi:hypothetical protein